MHSVARVDSPTNNIQTASVSETVDFFLSLSLPPTRQREHESIDPICGLRIIFETIMSSLCRFQWEMIEYYRRWRGESLILIGLLLGSFQVWIIIVAVLAGVLLLAVLIIVCCICRSCKKRRVHK